MPFVSAVFSREARVQAEEREREARLQAEERERDKERVARLQAEDNENDRQARLKTEELKAQIEIKRKFARRWVSR